MDRIERFEGCLLGGAVGDALGAGIEFLSLDAIRRRYGPDGITDYVPAYGGIGRITDDTQMSLFTAEGLLRSYMRAESKGLCDVPAIVLGAYYRWLATQGEHLPYDSFEPDGWLVRQEELHERRAPGNTCVSALRTGRYGTRTEPLNDSKGCGGVMRVAPVGLVALDSFELGTDLAALTHGHPTGCLAAGAFALVIRQVVRDWPLREAISLAYNRLLTEPDSDETIVAIEAAVDLADSGQPPTPEMVQSLGQGWVAEEALAIGLYCALVAHNFRDGVLLAVNHGGDSDTTGALTGNILGALLGTRAIPPEWLERLELCRVVRRLAKDLYRVASGNSPAESDPAFRPWWDRYPGW